MRMGDSDLPPVPVAGGSNNAASTTHVAYKACEEALRRLAEAAVAGAGQPVPRRRPGHAAPGGRRARGAGEPREPLRKAVRPRWAASSKSMPRTCPQGLPPDAMARALQGQADDVRGDGRKDVTAFAFGAHFVEVRVHARTREIRAPRVVSRLRRRHHHQPD